MYTVVFEPQFYHDVEEWKKVVPNLHKELEDIVSFIIEEGYIPEEYDPHVLTNKELNYTGSMEFHLLDGHIDLLVIYSYRNKTKRFRFIRLGSHQELFHRSEK